MNNCDLSFYADAVRNSVQEAMWEFQRPSMLLHPKLSLDGNQYCAGFGDTADAAMRDFDKNWQTQKAPDHPEPRE